jgi:DNA repair protein SbcD/Mre11
MPLTILHTSDWHLGKCLYDKKRYTEFEAFLNWLYSTVQEQKIDVVLVAGDVFDTTTPSNKAQDLYFTFLARVSQTQCRHVVVIGGNHDSPSLLEAPKEILRALNVYVVGAATQNIENEVLCLKNSSGNTELIVCAVPYLRDTDIRTFEAGESTQAKEQKVAQGIAAHYAKVVAHAESLNAQLPTPVPLVGMGHLFAVGGQVIEGDGVRPLHVGTLANVSASIFPPSLKYVALGHLHVPQVVGGIETIRYSGSPIPMGFGEAKQQKNVCVVSFLEKNETSQETLKIETHVNLLPIPKFQLLESISGNLEEILEAIEKKCNEKIWIEIVYTGKEMIPNLRERIEEATKNSSLEVLKIKNLQSSFLSLKVLQNENILETLSEEDVFKECLKLIPEHQHEDLLNTYREVLNSLEKLA